MRQHLRRVSFVLLLVVAALTVSTVSTPAGAYASTGLSQPVALAPVVGAGGSILGRWGVGKLLLRGAEYLGRAALPQFALDMAKGFLVDDDVPEGGVTYPAEGVADNRLWIVAHPNGESTSLSVSVRPLWTAPFAGESQWGIEVTYRYSRSLSSLSYAGLPDYHEFSCAVGGAKRGSFGAFDTVGSDPLSSGPKTTTAAVSKGTGTLDCPEVPPGEPRLMWKGYVGCCSGAADAVQVFAHPTSGPWDAAATTIQRDVTWAITCVSPDGGAVEVVSQPVQFKEPEAFPGWPTSDTYVDGDGYGGGGWGGTYDSDYGDGWSVTDPVDGFGGRGGGGWLGEEQDDGFGNEGYGGGGWGGDLDAEGDSPTGSVAKTPALQCQPDWKVKCIGPLTDTATGAVVQMPVCWDEVAPPGAPDVCTGVGSCAIYQPEFNVCYFGIPGANVNDPAQAVLVDGINCSPPFGGPGGGGGGSGGDASCDVSQQAVWSRYWSVRCALMWAFRVSPDNRTRLVDLGRDLGGKAPLGYASEVADLGGQLDTAGAGCWDGVSFDVLGYGTRLADLCPGSGLNAALVPVRPWIETGLWVGALAAFGMWLVRSSTPGGSGD